MGDAGSLFLLGLLYGMTLCSLSCLPYLGPYLVGTGQGFRDGVRSSLTFASGKVFVYAIFGGIAAFIGSKLEIKNYAPLQYAIGGILIVVALTLPFINQKGCSGKHRRIGKRVSLFSLGVSTSLIPCPTLIAMTLLAAQSGSMFTGIFYGLLFGLGIMISPLIIAGGGISMISSRVKVEASGFKPYLNGLSVIIMLMMGIRVLTLPI